MSRHASWCVVVFLNKAVTDERHQRTQGLSSPLGQSWFHSCAVLRWFIAPGLTSAQRSSDTHILSEQTNALIFPFYVLTCLSLDYQYFSTGQDWRFFRDKAFMVLYTRRLIPKSFFTQLIPIFEGFLFFSHNFFRWHAYFGERKRGRVE